MWRRGWKEPGVGTGAGQEIIEEILAGDYSVSEELSDYGYVMNRKPRPAF